MDHTTGFSSVVVLLVDTWNARKQGGAWNVPHVWVIWKSPEGQEIDIEVFYF